MRVYLAGGIAGLTYGECTEWRNVMGEILDLYGIEAVSPMRGKAFLKPERSTRMALKSIYSGTSIANKHTVFHRDKWDCLRSDAIVFNFLNAKAVSIGSMFEMAWAQDHGKYILTMMENGNLHFHPFVLVASTYVVESSIEAIKHLLVTSNIVPEAKIDLSPFEEILRRIDG